MDNHWRHWSCCAEYHGLCAGSGLLSGRKNCVVPRLLLPLVNSLHNGQCTIWCTAFGDYRGRARKNGTFNFPQHRRRSCNGVHHAHSELYLYRNKNGHRCTAPNFQRFADVHGCNSLFDRLADFPFCNNKNGFRACSLRRNGGKNQLYFNSQKLFFKPRNGGCNACNLCLNRVLQFNNVREQPCFPVFLQ